MTAIKPYNNKKVYDPGRLRNKITFLEKKALNDGMGGSEIDFSPVVSTYAGKEKLSQYKQLMLAQSNQFQMEIYTYFVIRNRSGFYPAKDMVIQTENAQYTVYGVVQMDDPCTYIQVLCVQSK